MNERTRSPIKDKPLRLPGRGLQEERQQLWDDKLEPALLLALVFFLMALLEWWRAWREMPPSPWIFTVVAIAFAGFAAYRFHKYRPRMRTLRQGMDGELAVGQYLERMREQGYQVFHDVVADNFNIDHVLIGPAGVFTIETKTWSKPVKGDARVVYDGEQVLVNGREPERDVRVQALSQGRWLSRLLEESTGRRLAVQPVVVFPGWFVEAAPGTQRDVWFMEPKGLPAFLARQRSQPAPEDMKLAAFHLSRYVRVRARQDS
ncbi:MAG: nuclease-related domain-containing protein [Rubrivivax sp.]|nr:nuclease-related domain-containing protein [Rubrivivax sp.]